MSFTKSPTKVVPLDNHWRLNYLLPHLATITKPNGERHTSYFGFSTYQEARTFSEYLISNKLCTKVIIRRSQRLSSYQFEIKAWGVGSAFLVRILNRQSLSLIDCLKQFKAAS